MRQIGLWQVTAKSPKKLHEKSIDLEKYLEEWIETDSEMLQDGLVIVGRQISVAGGPVDLLALDPQGRWVVIEVKRGAVRRETITQALDYASAIATMPFDELSQKVDAYLKKQKRTLKALLDERGIDENAQVDDRDVIMFVVGTGQEPGLERMTSYLVSKYEMPINVILYQVFETQTNELILVREITESESPSRPAKQDRVTLESLIADAEQNGVGHSFKVVLEAAQRHDLYPRLWASSIMYTSPANRTRMLFTVWVKPKRAGHLKAYIGHSAFSEYFAVAEEQAKKFLGPEGYRDMTAGDVKQFTEGLDSLFAQIAQTDKV